MTLSTIYRFFKPPQTKTYIHRNYNNTFLLGGGEEWKRKQKKALPSIRYSIIIIIIVIIIVLWDRLPFGCFTFPRCLPFGGGPPFDQLLPTIRKGEIEAEERGKTPNDGKGVFPHSIARPPFLRSPPQSHLLLDLTEFLSDCWLFCTYVFRVLPSCIVVKYIIHDCLKKPTSYFSGSVN